MNTKTFLTYYLPNIMFNIAEIGAIVGVGILFKVPIPYIISIFVCFILNRLIFRKSMHYKDWYLCFIWSTLLFISFFLLSKIDIHLASISTCLFIFFTNKVDIKDLNKLFFWGGNVLNQEVFDWVKFNQNNEKLNENKKGRNDMINAINPINQTVQPTANVIFIGSNVKTNACNSCCGWLNHNDNSGIFTITKP